MTEYLNYFAIIIACILVGYLIGHSVCVSNKIKSKVKMINILPNNDLESHTENTTCKCEPRVIYHNGETIVIHNSFDGREGVEWVNEILNN